MALASLPRLHLHTETSPAGARTFTENSTSSQEDGNVDPELNESHIAFVFFTCIFDLVTILGNGLVIVAFTRDPSFRSPRNYFILNLAISDLLIATVSVPFFIAKYIMQRWAFGREFCTFWSSVDLVCRLESVFIIVLITHDRYCLVRNPVAYHVDKVQARVPLRRIIFSWITSICMRFPFVLYTHVYIARKGFEVPCSPYSDLDAPFHIGIPPYDISYTTFSVLFEYFIPLFLIIYWNTHVFIHIRKRSMKVVDELVLCPVPFERRIRRKGTTTSSVADGGKLPNIQEVLHTAVTDLHEETPSTSPATNMAALSTQSNFANGNSEELRRLVSKEVSTIEEVSERSEFSAENKPRGNVSQSISEDGKHGNYLNVHKIVSHGKRQILTAEKQTSTENTSYVSTKHGELSTEKSITMISNNSIQKDFANHDSKRHPTKNMMDETKQANRVSPPKENTWMEELKPRRLELRRSSSFPILKKSKGLPRQSSIHRIRSQGSRPPSTARSLRRTASRDSSHYASTNMKRHVRRAAVVLVIITVQFFFCRTPYVVSRVMVLICDDCVPYAVYQVNFWLGWMLSMLNPFMYAFISANFQQYCTKVYQSARRRIKRCCP